ncbi:MAG: calcium/sodium antiporter [Intestinibacter bartlettii]|uniref:calcium/sodium antiporter n=1 Tax=Intestinibacter bartlettii TaxID=261299 RepID=UPI0026ED459D|nr:calcium/sodium antiporter [Intestinibacter bartlettii]MDO5009672.1 calcium/sodium antiporter [Intestinibacter bartlettii]
MNYILLLIGFVFLVKGADGFVFGASSIAKKFSIPPLIIGLTIVAFGTSAPEAAVSVTAALKGQNDMAIANVVGSNIFNFLVVIGLTSMIKPIKVQKSTIIKEFPFVILASFVFSVISHDTRFQNASENMLSRADGYILLSLFAIFMYYLIEMALTSKDSVEEEEIEEIPLSKSIIYTIIGIAGIIIGGQLVVNSASNIALAWGMSQNLVGLTIVSIGTSLPELVTSIVAARKGESDIAIGNAVGSNIFNLLLVLGLSSSIHSIVVHPEVFYDMLVMILATILTYIFAITKRCINRAEGTVLFLLYVIYLIYIIMR